MLRIPGLFENRRIASTTADGGEVVRRMLHIDAPRARVALIVVGDPAAMPEWMAFVDLSAGFAAATLRLKTKDDWLADSRDDRFLSDASKATRDRRWSVVGPLVDGRVDPDQEILDVAHRRTLITAAHLSSGAAIDNIYDWLRLFWQRGQTRNALLSGYSRCGARLDGRPRAVGTTPRGRPSNRSKVDGVRDTLNVTPEVKAKIVKGGTRYWKKTINGQQLTLKQAYHRTLADFFSKRLEFIDGVFEPIVWEGREDDARLPTYRQFCWWLAKAIRLEDGLKARYGKRAFVQKHRPVLGTSAGLSRGPADLFQIDATPGDIYLLSSIDPTRTIGRPVIYFVVDHWSRMIAGYFVGVEGPSWAGARMAFENTFTDKVAHCARFGIEIEEADWPCAVIPRAVMGDRGEMISEASDDAGWRLGFRIENPGPWRPDMKSYVEGQFKITNEKGIRRTPGSTNRHRDRGDPDYRLDATLNIRDFNKLIIRLILHNNSNRGFAGQVPEGFPRSQDDLPVPIDLWNWGLENRIGLARTLPREVVRANLLPTFDATAQREGLSIQNGLLHFYSATAHAEGWFLEGVGRKSKHAELMIDERDISCAFLLRDKGRTVEECPLTAAHSRFLGMSLADVLDDRDQIALSAARGAGRNLQAEARLGAHVDAITGEAKRRRQAALGKGVQKANVRDVRGARAEERELQRKEGAFIGEGGSGNDPPAEPDDEGLEDGWYKGFPS